MAGTIVNTCCIIVGSIVGSLLRRGINEKYQEALFTALGVCTVLLGANAFVHNMPKSQYPVLFIVAMALGSAAGCAMKLEKIRDFRIRRRAEPSSDSPDTADAAGREKPRLADGLTTGCLLYCIGLLPRVLRVSFQSL